MNPLKAIARWARSVSTAVTQGSIGYAAGGPMWLDEFKSKRPPTPPELVNQVKAFAFACMRLNAHAVARVPLRLYAITRPGDDRARCATKRLSRRQEHHARSWLSTHARISRRFNRAESRAVMTIANGDVDIEEVTESPFLDAFNVPNPYFDCNLLMLYTCMSLDAIGAAYWYPVRPDRTFAFRELWPLLSQYVYPIKGDGRDGNVLSHYNFFSERFERDELIRFRFPSLRDPYLGGFSPLHACFEQVGLANAYTSVVESILHGGARPGLMVGPKSDMARFGEPERKRLEIELNNSFTRARSGRVWVVDGSFDATPISYPPAELGGLEITQAMRLLIANCFDVPIALMQTEDSNRAVAESGNYQHQRNAVEPRCNIIASALTTEIRETEPRLFVCFDEAVEQDKNGDAEVFSIYLDKGVLSPDEVRQEIGYPPAEEWDGSEPYLPGGVMQPSTAADDRESKKQAAADMAAKLAEAGNPAQQDGDDDEPGSGKAGDDAGDGDAADRALMLSVVDTLTDLRRTLADAQHATTQAPPGPGDGHSHRWRADTQAARRQGRAKHVRPAAGQPAVEADPPLGESPAPGSTPGGEVLGDPTGSPADAGAVHRPDGRGDDADPVGVLERERPADALEGGPGPEPVAGDEPTRPSEDPASGPEVLPSDEPDHGPGVGQSARAAAPGADGGPGQSG